MVASGAAEKSTRLATLAMAPSRLPRTTVSPSLEVRTLVYWRRITISARRVKKSVTALAAAIALAARLTTVMPWVTVVTPYIVVPAAKEAVLMALAWTATMEIAVVIVLAVPMLVLVSA